MTKKKPGYPEPPKVVEVTPDMATKWLEGNVHNRRIRQPEVNKFSRDMKAGKWYVTHQGIAFDEKGTLVDGQHRLWAIIESGCTVPMMVHHGLPMESQSVIDTHIPRNSVDRLGLCDRFGDVPSKEPACLKRMLKGVGLWPKITPVEEVAEFDRHRAAIKFAVGAFPAHRARITVSSVFAVVARAYYSIDKDELRRFASVLLLGERSRKTNESVIILLRDCLISVDGTGRNTKPDVAYAKTETALNAYIVGTPLKKLYPATEELFFLPGERARQTPRHKKQTYDASDRAMKYLREHGESSIKDIAAGVNRGNTSVRRALNQAVTLGWAKEVSKAHGHNSARFAAVVRG